MLWEQYVETVNHMGEVSCSEAHIDYLSLPWVYFEAYPLQRDTPLHIAEDRFRGTVDRRIIEIPVIEFRVYSIWQSVLLQVRTGEVRSDHLVGHLMTMLSSDLKQ